MDCFREFFARHPPRHKYTALILLSDESMTGAVAALQANGLVIPDDVAVATVGNGRLSRNIYPPITTYDPDIEGHVRHALQMLDYNLEHPEAPKLQSLVPPKLIFRESTGGKK
jgi:DNA-binding LacI/PurR family transcriptional regulator